MLMGSAFAANAQEITFAMEPSYPPFETTNEKGEIIGFDVDVANAICKEIQATCHFKSQSFDALIPILDEYSIQCFVLEGKDNTQDSYNEYYKVDTVNDDRAGTYYSIYVKR